MYHFTNSTENPMHNNKKAFLVRLNKIKYYIRRFGIIKTAKKIILPTITMAVLNISNLSAQEPQTKNLQPSSNNQIGRAHV